jgi:hypothetical protein
MSVYFQFSANPSFPALYRLDDFCILNKLSRDLGHFPFPDMKEVDPDIADIIRQFVESPPRKRCRVALLQVMPHECLCKPFGHRIRDNLPPPMDDQLLNHIVHGTE